MSTCSVAASYKPPMLVTRVRLPACAVFCWLINAEVIRRDCIRSKIAALMFLRDVASADQYSDEVALCGRLVARCGRLVARCEDW